MRDTEKDSETLHESGFTSDKRVLRWGLVAFLAVATLAAVDLGSDLQDGLTIGHVLAEGGIFLTGLLGAWVLARKMLATMRAARATAGEARDLASQLEATRAQAERWREASRDLMAGLSQAIDRQLTVWQLSPAEKEVALLLLKGLSHREIGEVRTVTEATARQQARAVYKKAGLSGRNDLAAFFLEDLMLPTTPETRARAPVEATAQPSNPKKI